MAATSNPSRLYLGPKVTELELRDDVGDERFARVEVIRQGGPRSGQRMGWAVIDLVEATPRRGDFDVHFFPSRSEAESEARRLLG